MTDDKYKLCTFGIVEVAETLVDELDAQDLPDDYDPGDFYYNQVLAEVRHEYTNNDELLYRLPSCIDYFHQGGLCPHDHEDGDECLLVSIAHDTLKWAAKDKAEMVYQSWLERKKKESP